MKMWAVAFLFFLLLQAGAGQKTCTVSPKLDLQIIVDSSGSVREDNFHTMMEKISKSFISQFEIGKDKTRVALFKFSMPRVMRNEFSLNKFSDKKKLQAKLEGTKFEPGWTMTAMAMKKSLELFKRQQRKDKETARVCIVFTDGEASDPDKVPAASKLWADDGVTVFAIGIGDKVSHEGLKAIAGADERAVEVSNFAAIGEMAKSILKKICENIVVPTPPKPAVTVPPKPAVTVPPKPAVTVPPKPVTMPPKPVMLPKPCISDSLVELVKEDFKEGKAGASSYLGGHGPSQAFEFSTPKGTYIPWANLNTATLPQTVWYQFKYPITLAKFSFSSRDKCCLQQSPLEFQLVGSDDCKSWEVIKQYGTKFSKLGEEKTWSIPSSSRISYKCFGIKVLKVTSGVYAAIRNMKMWKVQAATEKMVPVDFSGGQPGASSFLAGHTPKQAFELNLWTGAYHPWANLNTAKFPHTIWYRFSEPVTVARFAFSSRGRCCLEQSPLEFQFVGSMDCKNWQVIRSYKTKFSRLNEIHAWTLPEETRNEFRCYGLKVTKVSSGIYTAIKHFRMWKPEPLIPANFKGGKEGASSYLAQHGPQQAFDLNLWKGAYLPWANSKTAKFPHTVWYQFSEPIKVGKFAFSSRSRCCLEQSPTEFQLVGSNDCKNWCAIKSFKTKFTKLNERKSWTIPFVSRQKFTCYGIMVTKVSGGIYTAIKHLKMFKEDSKVLSLVSYKGGSAGASSSLGGHGPNQAFELGIWKGAYHPWANLNTAKFPHTIWYNFPTKVRIGKFEFSSRDRCCLEQSPVEFQFVGSNDCKTWTVIQTYKTKFTKLKENKSWTIPTALRKSFKCYGLKVTKVTKGIYAAIKHMKFWSSD